MTSVSSCGQYLVNEQVAHQTSSPISLPSHEMIIGDKKGRSVSLSCRLQCPVPSSNRLQLSFIEKNKLPLGKLHQLHDKPRNAC